METDRPVDAIKMAIATVLNSLGNAAIQQSQTASAIDELTKMFLLSKEVEQELEFSLRKSRAGRILILFM